MDRQRLFKWSRTAALAVAPLVAARVSAACPDLFTQAGLLGLVGGLAAAYLASRKSSGLSGAVAHTTAWATVSSVWFAFQSQINAICGTEFLQQLPTIVVTASCVGIAALVNGKSE